MDNKQEYYRYSFRANKNESGTHLNNAQNITKYDITLPDLKIKLLLSLNERKNENINNYWRVKHKSGGNFGVEHINLTFNKKVNFRKATMKDMMM